MVRLDLPALHWRTAYWALAVWSVGATVSLVEGAADLTVTDDPQAGAGGVVVTLAALARSHPGPLPAGAMDEARELATYGDQLVAWAEPAGGDPALVTDGGTLDYASLVPEAALADRGARPGRRPGRGGAAGDAGGLGRRRLGAARQGRRPGRPRRPDGRRGRHRRSGVTPSGGRSVVGQWAVMLPTHGAFRPKARPELLGGGEGPARPSAPVVEVAVSWDGVWPEVHPVTCTLSTRGRPTTWPSWACDTVAVQDTLGLPTA